MTTLEAARAANAFSYSSAIVSCGSMPLASAWQRALNLWYDMADSVKSPNVVALNAKLGATWQFFGRFFS